MRQVGEESDRITAELEQSDSIEDQFLGMKKMQENLQEMSDLTKAMSLAIYEERYKMAIHFDFEIEPFLTYTLKGR